MQLAAVGADTDLEGATLVVGAMAGIDPAPGSEEVLSAHDLAEFAPSGFDGSAGQILSLSHRSAASLVVVGLGDAVSFEQLRAASGCALRAARTERVVSYLCRVPVESPTRAVVEGSVLGGYTFRRFKTAADDRRVLKVDMVDAGIAELRESWPAAEATNLARDWVNTPAGSMPPSVFADVVAEAATGAGMSVDVWDEERIRAERLGGLLAVASGSRRPPRLVILEHTPAGARFHLGLVGKGVTFDSGGLSIKPAKSMENMKSDMAGGAAVAAAAVAIAQLDLPLRVTAIVPISDNTIGGDAMRPGDVLHPVQGPSIEVLNTDAEGRLLLADGLGLMTRFDPDLTVDMATLTASAHVALGDQIAAVFASDRQTARSVLDAGSTAGEHLWELPLFEPYRKALESDIADIKNVTGSRYGGAITAALFLANYAGDGAWAHVDMASTASNRETSGEHVKGASGFGVRTLVELARSAVEAS